jgi:nucleoside-diphosphate-sugar epimerase
MAKLEKMLMRVFVAGATGAIGRRLVPRLVSAGHEVHAMTRSGSKRSMLQAWGAVPVVADALDGDQVVDVVRRARPDVIVHQLTSIAAEDDAFDAAPVAGMRENQAAMVHLESAVLGASWTTGVVLRYGWFYGPDTALAPGSEIFESIRTRKFPVVGDGAGVWSFIHVADAAEATVAAVERARRGIYNIVDDDPAPVSIWLPELARQLGARKPWRVPRLLGRLAVGHAGVVMMDELRGASNAKARADLAWQPAHPSWREALAAE